MGERLVRRIAEAMKNEHRIENHYAKNETQIFVKNLPETLTKEEFFKLFDMCDQLTGHRMIMKDAKCRGFGFVTFKTKQAAEKAVQMLHGKQRLPNGKFLHTSIVQQNVIFVKNLHEDVNWRMLIHMFAHHGAIKYAKVIMHERGFKRGYSSGRGIVCFHAAESASSAIATMNGQFVRRKSIRVEYYKSKYELKQEMFRTYFNRDGLRTSTAGSCSNTFSGGPPQPKVHSVSDLSTKRNDMAAVKQTYADKLSSFARLTQPAHYEQIAEILLEFDNTQLERFEENRVLLQTQVNEAATLITIGQSTF